MVRDAPDTGERLSDYLLLEDGKVSFNPQILAWARARSGLSVAQVARWAGEPPETIESWEAGDSTPTRDRLDVLAYLTFRLPFVTFFLKEVPDDSDESSLKAFLDAIERCAPPAISLEMAFTVYLVDLYSPMWSSFEEPPVIRNLAELEIALSTVQPMYERPVTRRN